MRGLNIASRIVLQASILLSVYGCTHRDGPPVQGGNYQNISDAVPRDEPLSKYGNMASYEVFGKRYFVLKNNKGFRQKGIASWYGKKFHGRKTSSGEVYDMYAMTAAHKTLPLPTYVEVVNLDNNRKAVVKVNDRGPFHEGRIIDLSYSAAKKLGVVGTGTANVEIRAVSSTAELKSGQSAYKAGSGKSANPTTVVSDPSLSSNNGKLYVQIAAFSTEKNAMSMLKSLRAKNFSDVRIHVDNKKNRTIYRVRIGPLPSETVAQRLVAELILSNHTNAKIVSYN